MSQELFHFQATCREASKLRRLLREATKKLPGAQQELNAHTAALFKRYGHEDPESYQITVVSNNMVIIQDYPTFEEIVGWD